MSLEITNCDIQSFFFKVTNWVLKRYILSKIPIWHLEIIRIVVFVVYEILDPPILLLAGQRLSRPVASCLEADNHFFYLRLSSGSSASCVPLP